MTTFHKIKWSETQTPQILIAWNKLINGIRHNVRIKGRIRDYGSDTAKTTGLQGIGPGQWSPPVTCINRDWKGKICEASKYKTILYYPFERSAGVRDKWIIKTNASCGTKSAEGKFAHVPGKTWQNFRTTLLIRLQVHKNVLRAGATLEKWSLRRLSKYGANLFPAAKFY